MFNLFIAVSSGTKRRGEADMVGQIKILRDRLMVGLQNLDLTIGVRIPIPQHGVIKEWIFIIK